MNTDELHPLQRRIAQGIAGATDSRLSAEDILSLGYRFWTEPGSGCLWIRNRHGVEITMHQLIVELVGESLKLDFITSVVEGEARGRRTANE